MCYSERWKPILILKTLSIVLLAGVLMIFIEMMIFRYKPSILTADLGKDLTDFFTMIRVLSFEILVLWVMFTLVLGLCGTSCHLPFLNDYIIIPMCWGCCICSCFIVTMAVGVNLASIGSSGPVIIEKYCEGEPLTSVIEPLIDSVEEADLKITKQANRYMCSQMCPCNTT